MNIRISFQHRLTSIPGPPFRSQAQHREWKGERGYQVEVLDSFTRARGALRHTLEHCCPT